MAKVKNGCDESSSEDDGSTLWNLNEVHEVRTSASHIRPKGSKGEKKERVRLPKTKKKSLIQRLSRRSSGNYQCIVL